MAPVGVAQATTPTAPSPDTEPSATPAGEPVSNGGVTVTILGVHPSVPANAVVVVAEVTTEIELTGSSPAIYVTENGQQFDADAFFAISATVFPGVTKVVAWSFGTADVDGTIHWTVFGVDVEPIEFSLPLS